ncbi:MAG: DUF2461 domain-containing protein [Eubacteriales bacterium]|nr:DUF2461 domain-containing protein [Eubacteriales bacterium]
MFEGFPEETVRFFLELRFHNNTTFFHEHRDEYEQFVKKPFYSFIEAVAPTAQKIAPDLELRPGKCLARINRDTRYTKDKSPYRDHLWLLLRRSGEQRDLSCMYWFELSPDRVSWGLGFWNANRPAMDALRRRMREKPEEVIRALRRSRVPAPDMLVSGERYRRMALPEGLPLELAPYYPLKDIYIQRGEVPLQKIYTPEIAELFSADLLRLKPLYQLLRRAADEGMAALDA